MNSRQLTEDYGMNVTDLSTLCALTLSSWSLTDLQYLLMQIEDEINDRSDRGDI